jgi:hypothetical protein
MFIDGCETVGNLRKMRTDCSGKSASVRVQPR